MTRKSIAKKLSLVASEKGITAAKIEKATNRSITFAQAKSVLTGEKNFTIDTMLSVCETLGVTIIIDDAGKKKSVDKYDGPKADLKIINDEPSKLSTRPKTLAELKSLCPHKSGLERSAWIAENRKKHGL